MRRPGPPKPIPPPLELECLKALWRLGEASVRQVQNDLAPEKGLAYTTVMTLLDRLVRKGGATRRKQGRMFLYSARLSPEVVRELAVQELVNNLFDGSREKLIEFIQGRDSEDKVRETGPATNGLDTTLL